MKHTAIKTSPELLFLNLNYKRKTFILQESCLWQLHFPTQNSKLHLLFPKLNCRRDYNSAILQTIWPFIRRDIRNFSNNAFHTRISFALLWKRFSINLSCIQVQYCIGVKRCSNGNAWVSIRREMGGFVRGKFNFKYEKTFDVECLYGIDER